MADDPETVNEPEKPKANWWWMKDTNGQASVSITMVAVSFFVTTLAYIGSIFVKIGPIEFRQFDAGACAAYLIPCLSVYFGRRWTKAKMGG